MYNVSANYKENSLSLIRRPSHVKISFGVVDPQGSALSAPMDNGHEYYSDIDSIDLGVTPVATYQTLEPNRFILDGINPLAYYDDPQYQGYIGNEISDSKGIWSSQPTITITFSAYTSFSALTLNFDTVLSEYPAEMDIVAYKDGEVVSNETIYPDTAENWIYTTSLPTLNALVLIFKKSLRPYRRARLLGLLYGFTQLLQDGDISSCDMSKKVDMLSTTLPQLSFNFTLLDQDKIYDPESPDTLWDYLESLQPVYAQIGMELDDAGTIEWMPLCTAYTTGDVSVSSQGVVTKVTFEATSILQQWTDVYTRGLYRAMPISLYDLTYEVLDYLGFSGTAHIDLSLQTLYTTMPLPLVSCSQCLQLIANAGMCVLDVDRTGAITMTKYSTQLQDFDLSFDYMTEEPTTNKVAPLRNVITKYYATNIDTETSTVASADVVEANNDTIVVQITSGATNVAVTTTGLTNVSYVAYTYSVEVTCTGTGTISVTGKVLKINSVEVVKNYHELGSDATISNSLIDSYAKAVDYANWAASIYRRRIDYTESNVGFPELDILDDITTESNFGNKLSATIFENSISYNGSITGKSRCLVVKED